MACLKADLLCCENTEKWHYIDHAYSNDKKCRTIEPANAVWAIDKLEYGLAKTSSLNSKAVQMVLLEHYIGDLHQPLHNITNISDYCEGDRGGNDFCLKENSRGKCVKNLHSLWDNGLTRKYQKSCL